MDTQWAHNTFKKTVYELYRRSFHRHRLETLLSKEEIVYKAVLWTDMLKVKSFCKPCAMHPQQKN